MAVGVCEEQLQPLEGFRLEAGRSLLLATYPGRACFRAEPFEAYELELALLWGEV